MTKLHPLGLVLALTLGCNSNTPSAPVADVPAVNDLGVVDASDAGATIDIQEEDVPPPPVWPRELPPARIIGEARGYRAVRSIIHAHSVHSHDACDGNPYVDGGPNEPCLQSFRAALCRTRIDVIFLTEHDSLMATVPFETVLQMRPGDEPVMQDGRLVGSRIGCPDGHRVLLLPGAENDLMPIGLTRHPDPLDGSLARSYNANDPAAVARFRAAGGLVAIPHVEQVPIAHLREIGPDLVEIYNVHANLDPRIAGPHLGYNVGPALADILRFQRAGTGLDPEMLFMVFFQESANDLGKWAQLLTDGRRIPGFGASDAHENVLPAPLTDGERGDSYRRVFRWFNNQLWVQGELTRESAMEAIRQSRVFVTFEAFGTPVGFSYTAQTGDRTREIGEEIMLSESPVLRVTRPQVHQLNPLLPAPTTRLRILRAEAAGTWTEVAVADAGDLSYTPTAAGVYRAEVRITPNHLRPYLPGLERLMREVPWVYSSPMYVR
ncbi:MAG: hypothetical protein Q8S73_22230 [Deltaproteobacteria bacterium]|nr:hypothetical protein [Myxococcales bacterium]MDP3216844.1 hypothetical protein [Deltaproteobacteria bacterium]